MPATDDECVIALQAKQITRGDYPLLMFAQPYMFPLEAYVMAPVIEFLPRTAFGARIVAFGLGLLSTVIGWLVLRRLGRLSQIWPGLLLLLFASPFFLILQYGVALPGYPSLILLSSLMVWLAYPRPQSPAGSWLAALGVGILGGLACSVTMLALPVLMMAGTLIGFHRNGQTARSTLPLVILGTLAGSLPYWLAQVTIPGTGVGIFRTVHWRDALGHLISPTLSVTVPGVLGLACPVVPGSLDRVAGYLVPAPVYGWIWFLSLIGITIKALARGWSRWRQDRWPSLDFGLMFAGISWLCLVLFLFSSRSGENTFRYLVLIAWAWPFLLAYAYCHTGAVGRLAIGAVATLALAVNLYNAMGLLERWNHPDFTRQLQAHDLNPVIRYLDSRGIRHAYSTYSDSYRLTYETDERIICAQLYNERFPYWLLPYKTDGVDPATNVAYVLSMHCRFTSAMFERDMKSAQVTCRIQPCGAYKVYTDFASSMQQFETKLFTRMEASHSPEKATDRINDPVLFWRSEGSLQQTGMWVSVEWEAPRQVGHVLLDHGAFAEDCPDTAHVYYKTNGQWVKLPDPLSGFSMPFMFSNGHPIYDRERTVLDFPFSVETTGLKLEIANPRRHRAWTICSIALAP